MKKPFTVFIQACKSNYSSKFTIELNTTEGVTSEYFLYITIGQQSFEIDMPDIDQEKLTLAHIDYLKSLKDSVKAKAQKDLNKLDSQINELLALENKGVA